MKYQKNAKHKLLLTFVKSWLALQYIYLLPGYCYYCTYRGVSHQSLSCWTRCPCSPGRCSRSSSRSRPKTPAAGVGTFKAECDFVDTLLKGQCHEIFESLFCQSSLPGSYMNSQNRFRKVFCFREDISENLYLRSHWQRWNGVRKANDYVDIRILYFVKDYLRKNDKVRETVLACSERAQRTQVECFMKKK